MTSYIMTPVIEPTNFLEVILSFSYNLQYQIYWWTDTYYTEGPYQNWELFAGYMMMICIGILLYSTVYGIIYFLFSKKLASIKNNHYFKYPNWINVLIRLIPFGYILTSIHTIISGKGFGRGLIQELIYTLGVSAIYIIGYISHYYISIIR